MACTGACPPGALGRGRKNGRYRDALEPVEVHLPVKKWEITHRTMDRTMEVHRPVEKWIITQRTCN